MGVVVNTLDDGERRVYFSLTAVAAAAYTVVLHMLLCAGMVRP
jgi:hypothetical protein